MILKYRFSISAADPDKLSAFYINDLGMKFVVKVDRSDDYGYGIEVVPGYKLWIAKHSEVVDKNNDLFRHMLTLYVDDINLYCEKLKSNKGAQIIQEPTLACEGIKDEERLVMTFLDPERNCVQLMQLTGN
jgi:extradiol dioxygenase family protein